MKIILLFLFFTYSCFTGYTQKSLNIHIEKAGTLYNSLPEGDDIEFIKITGYLNDTDFKAFQKLKYHSFSLDLSEVVLDKIPYGAFSYSKDGTLFGLPLKKIVLPETITSIGDYAFSDCGGLQEVNLSRCAKLNYIGSGAFAWCRKLLSIDLRNCYELKYLGGYSWNGKPEEFQTNSLFEECSSLQDVVLPPNLEVIGPLTFFSANYPTALSRIEIPATIKEIGALAFSGCNKLIEVKMKVSTPPSKFYGYEESKGNHPFQGIDFDNCILKVPLGSKSSYKLARMWKDFQKIEEYSPIKNYLLKIIYNQGGSLQIGDDIISSETTITFEKDNSIQILIIPDKGYHLQNVRLGEFDVTNQLSNNILSISELAEYENLIVTFEKDAPNTCFIKVSYSIGGTVKVNNNVIISESSTIVTCLTDVEISIFSDKGYHLKKIKVGEIDMTDRVNNNILTVSSITGNADIIITFEKDIPIVYTVKVSYSGEGIVKVNSSLITNGSSISVTEQIDCQLSIVPNTGYHIKHVLVGSTDMTASIKDNLLVLPAISEDKDIKISFEKNEQTSYTFRIFYYGSGNGSVMVNGNMAPNGYSITVPVTKKIELIFQSDEGYYLKQAILGSVDITKQIVDNHYTIPALSSDASLSVTFEKIPTYSLNINMVDGSSSIKINEKVITNSTQITEIKEGSPILLNFMPSKYYAIKNVTLGDKNITGLIKDGFYEIKSIKSNLSLQVEYSKKEYTLLLTSLQGIERIRIGNAEHYDKSSFILTPGVYNLAIFSNSNYLITQVLSEGEKLYDNLEGESSYFGSIDIDHDKEITILLKLREKRERTVVLKQPGTLSSFLTEEDMNLITHLRVEGKIDQRDFVVINQMKLLSKLSLEASIVNYSIYPANTIPEKAFYNNRNIQTIYLPNSIEAIDKQAFYGSFISLLEASGDSYKHLNKIGEEAFKNCQYLIEAPLLITNVPVIEKGVFENCSNLITFSTSLPNLVEIKESAFRNCKKLCLSFESSLERIGDYAFENMKSVNFYSWIEEAKLSYLSTNALKGCPTDNFDFTNYPYLKELPVFEGCSKMVSITFPPNVKRISTNTFKGCTSLQHVHMNEKIEYIAENAFCDCKGITNLYVPINKAPEVFANSFSDFNYVLAKLVVPADYMYFYRYHTVWGKFNNIEYFGENSVRQIQTVISQGGFVKLKGENNISFDETICREGIYSNWYPTSSRVELIVEPEEGYSTESVILNGENITNRLDKNYKFVIPYLLDDTELEVKFKKDNSTDIEIINTKKRVYISDSNQLSLAGFRIGIYVSVYDTSGRLITQRILHDNMEKISLPCKGIYFIKVGKEAFKIIY